MGVPAALALLACWPLHASDAVLDAMQQELHRSVETLSGQPVPLYFLSYEITEELADSDRSIIYDQAENRLDAQKAILLYLV